MELKIDCSHFPGERPCRFHKESGVKCNDCPHYRPRRRVIYRFSAEGINVEDRKTTRILIIKMGAPGDVLRTTPLLHALWREYKEPEVYWITEKASAELLVGNTFLKKVIPYSKRTEKEIEKDAFDLLINPENTVKSARMAEKARAVVKLGYGMSERGFIYPFNEEAEYWLEMAGFDDVKRANRKTYQEILFEICGFKYNPDENKIILPPLIDREYRERLKKGHDFSGRVIGLHTGAGRRWQLKKWRIEGFTELAGKLAGEGNTVFLLGGRLEQKANIQIKDMVKLPNVMNLTVNDDLKKFVTAIDLCDIVVCGDTLALHLALGLGKRVVALFGPTSPWEIELYGQGTKVIPEIDCICCYREKCSKKPNCMDMISVDRVYEAVIRLI